GPDPPDAVLAHRHERVAVPRDRRLAEMEACAGGTGLLLEALRRRVVEAEHAAADRDPVDDHGRAPEGRRAGEAGDAGGADRDRRAGHTSPGRMSPYAEQRNETPAWQNAPWQRPPVARVRFRTASSVRGATRIANAAAISAAVTCSHAQITWP